MSGFQRAGTVLLGLLAVCAASLPGGNAAAEGHSRSVKALPAYKLEPPDLLQIEVDALVPKPSYRLDAYDVLQIQVTGTLRDQPIEGHYLIEAEGIVNLGPAYGTVRVAGLTVEKARQAVTDQLLHTLREPRVSLQLVRSPGRWQIGGVYLVNPDGTVNLGQYGAVAVSGKTLSEARLAILKRLRQFPFSAAIKVKLAGYNGKICHIITEGENLGDNIIRIPLSGGETVADALRQIGGVSRAAVLDVWLARPSDDGRGAETVLHVDWRAVPDDAHRGATIRLLPGDRVFVEEKRAQVAEEPDTVHHPIEPRRRLALRRRRT